ncbi:MAG: RNA polymerase sigma factor [Planctomycetota bacterium]
MSSTLMTAPLKTTFRPSDPLVDLVRRLMADPTDRAGREELALAVAPGLVALARRFCRLEQDADEAAQEALITVLTRLADLRDPYAFRSWMYRILYRACLKTHTGPGDQPMPLTLDPPDTRQAPPEDQALHREQLASVRLALSEIDRELAGLLHLLFVDDLSLQEVADVLGRPRTTVADMRDRALAALRGRMERKRGVLKGGAAALTALLVVALPQPAPGAAVQRVVNAAWTRIDGQVGRDLTLGFSRLSPATGGGAASAPAGTSGTSGTSGRGRALLVQRSLSQAFLLSCLASLALASIFLMFKYPRRTAETPTESTLRMITSAVQAYRNVYGAYPIDHDLVNREGGALEQPAFEKILNANLVHNLLAHGSQGELTQLTEARFRTLPGGRRVVLDEWADPLIVKPLIERHGNHWTMTGLVVYSCGPDGQHNWERLAYLARAGGSCWPPPDFIRRQWPADDPNLDNVYLPVGDQP